MRIQNMFQIMIFFSQICKINDFYGQQCTIAAKQLCIIVEELGHMIKMDKNKHEYGIFYIFYGFLTKARKHKKKILKNNIY